MNITFTNIEYKNFMKSGNNPLSIKLDSSPLTLLTGKNGSGKCVCKNTIIKVRNTKTGEIYETTIGDLYDAQDKSNRNN